MQRQSLEEELLDLVDLNDRVIGQKKRSEVHAENLTNYRLAECVIVNSKGQLWIPRRALHKGYLPGYFDTSAGGHVVSGESYEQALRRELKEELFLDLDVLGYRQLGLLTPHEHGIGAFVMLYEIKREVVSSYNKADFCEAFWLTPQQFLARVHQGEQVGTLLQRVIELFYLKKRELETLVVVKFQRG
jgi:isopentenyldiphosphate isomerase